MFSWKKVINYSGGDQHSSHSSKFCWLKTFWVWQKLNKSRATSDSNILFHTFIIYHSKRPNSICLARFSSGFWIIFQTKNQNIKYSWINELIWLKFNFILQIYKAAQIWFLNVIKIVWIHLHFKTNCQNVDGKISAAVDSLHSHNIENKCCTFWFY